MIFIIIILINAVNSLVSFKKKKDNLSFFFFNIFY